MSWLSDADGVPIDVAPSCVGFTVRHWPPKARGPGASLRDPTGSAALLVPTHTPPEQFRERVGDRPGKYLLTQVAASRRAIRGAAEAVVVLDPELTLDHAIGPSALDRVLSMIAAADQRTAATLAAFVERTAAELAQLRHQVDASLAELRAILIAPEFQTIAALMGGQQPAKPPPPRATAPRSTVAPVAAPRPSPPHPAALSAAPAPLQPRAAPPPAAPPPASPSTASTDELLRVFGVVAAPAAPTPPPTHAPASAPPRAPTAPPYSDDEIRHAMTEVIDRLPPFPRAMFGEQLLNQDPAMGTLSRQIFEASRGDLDALRDLLLSRQFVERLLGPFAPVMGISIDTLHTYWTTTDEAEIPAQLLERLRT